MFFFAPLSWCRRLGRWLAYEWFQLALWLAFGLRFMTSVRSAFHSGATGKGGQGRAVRPRRFRRPVGHLRPTSS